MPRRLVGDLLASGELRLVPDTPEFPYSGYACRRRDLDAALAADLVHSLEGFGQTK